VFRLTVGQHVQLKNHDEQGGAEPDLVITAPKHGGGGRASLPQQQPNDEHLILVPRADKDQPQRDRVVVDERRQDVQDMQQKYGPLQRDGEFEDHSGMLPSAIDTSATSSSSKLRSDGIAKGVALAKAITQQYDCIDDHVVSCLKPCSGGHTHNTAAFRKCFHKTSLPTALNRT
jgi:hypothetical protein